MNTVADPSIEEPKAGRRFPKWVIIFSLLVVVLGTAGVARHYYLQWKEGRYIRHAKIALYYNDQNNLKEAVDQVLLMNPKNLEAHRISGRALVKFGNVKAMPWLRRAVELSSGDLEDEIALAEAALLFNQLQEAGDVIRRIEPQIATSGRADYHDLAGRIAQSLNQFGAAESHFAEALKLSPKDLTYRLRLAIIRFKSKDTAVQNEQRKIIQELLPKTEFRNEALRALVVDALQNIQPERALTMSTELDGLPNRSFSDHLMHLEVLLAVNSPAFQAELQKTEEQAAKNPSEILPLLRWMNAHQLSLLAKDWALKLPADSVSSLGIRLEIARAFAAFGDWKKLRFFLANEKWGDFEYMKKAFLARSYREVENSDVNSKATWTEALNAAENNGESLISMARMAMQWGWEPEFVQALWQAVQKSDRSDEALRALCEHYYRKRDTAGLYRAYALLAEKNPGEASARNNLAMFGLLLGREREHAASVARELYEKAPDNASYASTYAFALYLDGKHSQALEIMKKLKPEEQKNPSIAAYYGAILAAVGQKAEAEEYRKLAKGAVFLPEEERLLGLLPPKPTPQPTPAPAAP